MERLKNRTLFIVTLIVLVQITLFGGLGQAVAQEMKPLLAKIVNADSEPIPIKAPNPIPVQGSVQATMSNLPLDANGNLKVSEQGTSNVNVTNSSVPVSGSVSVSGSVGISGAANSVKLDAAGNTVKLDSAANGVKLDSSANTVKIDPANNTVAIAGGSLNAAPPLASRTAYIGIYDDKFKTASVTLNPTMNVSTLVLDVHGGGAGVYLDLASGGSVRLWRNQGAGLYTLQFPYRIPATKLSVTCDDVNILTGKCAADAYAFGD